MSATKLVSVLRTTSRSPGTRGFFFSSFSGPLATSHSTPTRSSCTLTQTQAEAMETPQELSSNKMFGGFNRRFKHDSSACGCPMTFSVYFPPAADLDKVPVLYWLSGLTCTDENFMQKSGAQRAAAACGVALISMDTSPRGLNVEGATENYDFGEGAGFYLNATQEKWKNWRMYDYVTKELPSVLTHFPNLDTSNASLFGHSMGGHGALTIFLKNPSKYKSVSAFAPIANPMQSPWGDKAFRGYLGDNKSLWEEYDATVLVKKYNGPKTTTILIDQGDADKFWKEKQLLPENFEAACKSVGMPVELHLQPGYDHSYFFIATFVDDHIQHHAKALGV